MTAKTPVIVTARDRSEFAFIQWTGDNFSDFDKFFGKNYRIEKDPSECLKITEDRDKSIETSYLENFTINIINPPRSFDIIKNQWAKFLMNEKEEAYILKIVSDNAFQEHWEIVDKYYN